jgi:hypothetical protein
MRDLVSDWKKWSQGERLLALIVAFSLFALPLSLLLTGTKPGI